jgi:SMC interacting uncharacterized protein involved in chromosome segregation
LESRLTEQSRLLTESQTHLSHLNVELESARKTEGDMRAAIAEIDSRTSSAAEKLKLEKSELKGELDRTRDERDRLAREIAGMKRETEEAWASERVENTLLRERINDVAAEVARLASTLEGPNSPIDAMLATESEHNLAPEAEGAPGEVAITDVAPAGGDLADRIRALQSHASRLPHGDKPN